MMPDDDLLNVIDKMASSSQARGGAVGYYLAEWDRRAQRKLNRTLVRLTKWLAVLTLVLVVLTIISTIVIMRGI